MESINETFGAKASIKIKFDGDIFALGEVLQKFLYISNFSIDKSEDYPYQLVGIGEALGFTLWLESTSSNEVGMYIFSIETGESLAEIAAGRMYDLSGWLAQYIANVCSLNVIPSENY